METGYRLYTCSWADINRSSIDTVEEKPLPERTFLLFIITRGSWQRFVSFLASGKLSEALLNFFILDILSSCVYFLDFSASHLHVKLQGPVSGICERFISDEAMRLFEFSAGLLYSPALWLIGLCTQSHRSGAMLTLTAQSMLAYCLPQDSMICRITDGREGHCIEVWPKFPLSEGKDKFVRLRNTIEIISSNSTKMTVSFSYQLVLDLLDYIRTSQEILNSDVPFFYYALSLSLKKYMKDQRKDTSFYRESSRFVQDF